jgi:signal transduction histidine kinase
MEKKTIQSLFQLDKPRPRGIIKEKGSGLGLILCRELLQKINSSIRVESEPRKGTTFYVKFATADEYIGK